MHPENVLIHTSELSAAGVPDLLGFSFSRAVIFVIPKDWLVPLSLRAINIILKYNRHPDTLRFPFASSRTSLSRAERIDARSIECVSNRPSTLKQLSASSNWRKKKERLEATRRKWSTEHHISLRDVI